MRYSILASLVAACSLLVLGAVVLQEKRISFMAFSDGGLAGFEAAEHEAKVFVPETIPGVSVIRAR